MSSPSVPLHQRPPWSFVYQLLTDPRYFTWLAGLAIVGDAVLTQLIIRFIAYTEIDWETYMYQLELYMKGERDYALISGPTGPIVYPAGHIWVHRFLYILTNAGQNIRAAQHVYAALYVSAVALTCAVYRQAGSVPNWVLLLLPLSKRLHSIYVLRLFNDCWTAVAAQAAVLAFGQGWDAAGILLLGAALSVKMSVLLYLPGLLVVLFQRRGLLGTAAHLVALAGTQVLVGLPFLLHHPRSYLNAAYEFSRVFLYKWTVNWRFVPEETFLGAPWARGLLVAHLSTLVLFGLFRWCNREGGVWRVLDRGLRRPTQPSATAPLTADYVTTVLYTSNLIGVVFARSLHYQFYSWYALQLPFLVWRTKFPVAVKVALLVAIEYAWNVFPSTSQSSVVLLVAHLSLLLGIWFGYPEGKTNSVAHSKTQ